MKFDDYGIIFRIALSLVTIIFLLMPEQSDAYYLSILAAWLVLSFGVAMICDKIQKKKDKDDSQQLDRRSKGQERG